MEYRPGVTLIVMVRDDEVRLRRCLSSAPQNIQDIIVLDTGSKDASVSVAKEFTGKVLQTEWVDDFSTSLNILLDAVDTEWTLRLDSDEWFSPGQETALEKAAQNDDVFLYSIPIRNIIPGSMETIVQIRRMWRTHPAMRYQGRIHEQFWAEQLEECSGNRYEDVAALEIWHDGYNLEDSTEKTERNLRLVELELEENPDRMYYRAVHADLLYRLNRPEADAAIEEILHGLVSKRRPPEEALIAILFARWMERLKDEDLGHPHVRKRMQYVLEHFSLMPGMLFEVARLEKRKGNYAAAIDLYLRIDAISQTDSSDTRISVNPSVFPAAWQEMVECGAIAGRPDVAKLGADKLATLHRLQR